MHRLLLDTNILLDAVMPNRPEHAEALRLLGRCNGGGHRAFSAATSFNDAYYILCRAYGELTARTAIGKLMGLVAVAPVSGEECDCSLHSNEPDFEDGIVRACAELNDADFIISRDARAFAGSKLKSMPASVFLAQYDDAGR